MIVSRDTAENILINKHELKDYIAQGKLIKGFPIVDSNSPAHIEKIVGNELRVLKNYAPAFDFIANLISGAHSTGRPERFITDVDENYYKMSVKETTWLKYFAQCGDHNIRQSLMKQVFKDLQTGYVLLPIYNKIHGRGLEKRAPFRVMAEQYYEDGTRYREIYFAKAVFQSLVTGECTENGGDGFIELPPNLYPVLTAGNKGELQSFNPVYKLNVHGLMKNTHKKDRIEIDRHELLRKIAPEYIDENGHMNRISPATLHDSLIENARAALTAHPYSLLVKNFFLGRAGGNSTLYFQTPPQGWK